MDLQYCVVRIKGTEKNCSNLLLFLNDIWTLEADIVCKASGAIKDNYTFMIVPFTLEFEE